jgi:hypothetical protein
MLRYKITCDGPRCRASEFALQKESGTNLRRRIKEDGWFHDQLLSLDYCPSCQAQRMAARSKNAKATRPTSCHP